MNPDDDLLERAGAVADGDAPGDHDDSPPGANLARLHGLMRLFESQRAAALDPPFVWAELEVEEVLGRGSFGTVYRARDPVLAREVALKLIDSAALDDAEFMAEARRLARVSHPNVLSIHGVESCDGRIGLWADLLGGRTLEQRPADGPIAEAELLPIAAQLAAALRAVHAAGLVHGDVKAGNVMIDESGHVTLMDFGAAHRAGRDGPRFGSPRSMAPEVHDGAAGSPAADQYALGVLLYRAIAGRHPHDEHDREALIERVRSTDADPQPLAPASSAMRGLVLDLLARDPEARPDAAGVVDRIAQIRSRPARRLRRVALAAVVGALTVGLVVTSVAFVQIRQSQREAEAALARAESVNALLTDLLAAPRPTEAGETTTLREALAQFEPRLATALTDQPRARARLLRTVGKTFLQLDDTQRARGYLDEAAELERAAGADAAGLLATQELLARVDLGAGDAEAALTRVERALARADAALQADHELHVALAVTRSHAHQRLGDLDASAVWAQRAVDAAEATAWQNPGNRVLAPLRMTNVLLAQGDVQAAEPWARRAVSVADERLGERNSNALAARGLLAQILVRTGRPAEALPLIQRLVETTTDWLGRDHEKAVNFRNLLAIAYNHLGRYAEAERVLDALVELKSAELGPAHRRTLSLRINRANARRFQGRVDVAIPEYGELIELGRAEFGPVAGPTRIAHANLCEALLDSGRIDAAAREAGTALAITEDAFGGDHPFTLHARMILAAADARTGEADRAVGELRSIVEQVEGAMGPEAPMTIQATGHLAAALHADGRRDESRELFDKLEARAVSALGDPHRLVRWLAGLRDDIQV